MTAAYRCWPTRRQTTLPRPPSRGSFTSCIYVVRQAFFRLAFSYLSFATQYCVRAGRASRRPRHRGSHPIRLFLSCCHIAALTGYASIQLTPPPPFRLSAAASNNYCNHIFRLSPFPCCTPPLFLLLHSTPFRCCMCCCCCITPTYFLMMHSPPFPAEFVVVVAAHPFFLLLHSPPFSCCMCCCCCSIPPAFWLLHSPPFCCCMCCCSSAHPLFLLLHSPPFCCCMCCCCFSNPMFFSAALAPFSY